MRCVSFRNLCSAVCLAVSLVAVSGSGASGQATSARAAAPASLIVEPIDDLYRVALTGTVHRLAVAENDIGVAPDSLALERVQLVLRRSESQEQALRQLLEDMHTPGNAAYHKWLTPDEFGRQFGPSEDDITAVKSWLETHGLAVTQVNPGRQTIEFSLTAGQFRTAFHSAIHRYRVNGQERYANATDPEIPAALAPVVAGFVSLNNFPAKSFVRVLGKAGYQPSTGQVTPQWTYGGGSTPLLAPEDFAVQYDLNPLYKSGANGAGQSIAIVNEANIDIEQVNQFRSIFGLPANPPLVVIDGSDPGIDGMNNVEPNWASTEAYLDVEWAGAVAPNATVYLVIAADSYLESGLLLAAQHAVYSNIAPVMSVSFGECEEYLGSMNSFLSGLWEQAAAQGITVMVSTGDNGSAGCDYDGLEYAIGGLAVNGFASTPYNVAVGGTDFYYADYENPTQAYLETYWNLNPTQLPQASLLQPIPEQPWNNSQYGLNLNAYSNGSSSIVGGGGGASSCESSTVTSGLIQCNAGYAKPAWQSGAGVPADSARDIPDVSLFAANGSNLTFFPICASDGDCQPVSGEGSIQISGVGGTSASAPAFAGMMAIVDQRYGRQGQAAAILYPLKTQVPEAFHDVTHGTNAVPCAFSPASLDCMQVANPFTVDDPSLGTAIEGELGAGITPSYNAGPGYNLATGLGSIDANQLVNHWGDVKLGSTTTVLASSSTSFVHGTPIAISGSVTSSNGTPTGDVALMTDSPTPLQQGITLFNLTDGTFSSASVVGLPGGTYNIWGQYGGDSVNAPSTSSKTQITVAPEDSQMLYFAEATNLGEIPWEVTSVPYEIPIYLQAQILPATCQNFGEIPCPNATHPTGTVTFTDNGTPFATLPMSAIGTVVMAPAISIGSHSIGATYSGDASYNPISAPAVSFTVVQDPSTVDLTVNGSSSGQGIQGQPTVLTVQVMGTGLFTGSAAAPTGTVTISGGPGGIPASASLLPSINAGALEAQGVATFVFPSSTPVGTYPVTVSYAGDNNYASSSAFANVVVAAAGTTTPTSLTVTANASSSSPFAAIAISGSVTGQTGSVPPSGRVNFISSGNLMGWVNLFSASTGSTTTFSILLTSQMIFSGANLITLEYSGDANYQPSITTLNLSNPLSDFTLVANASNVSLPSGGSATDNIQLSSVRGFAGTVSYACSAPSGITCALSPASSILSSGATAVSVLTVSAPASTASGSYGVLITGTDSAGQFIHTVGVQAMVGGSGNASPGFTLTNGGGVSVSSATSQGSTLTVTPAGGFSGAVNFTCSILDAPSGLTCSAPPASVSGTSSATSVLTVAVNAATPLGSYIATVTGMDAATGMMASGTAVNITVVAPPSFVLTNSQSIAMATAATQSSTLSISPLEGFAGNVNFSCSVSESPAGLTCSAPSVTVTGTDFTASTLSVSTASATPAGTYAATVTATDAATGEFSAVSSLPVVVVSAGKSTPTMAVTPALNTITTAQTLAVTIGVSGGNGNATPTGTVTLIAGSFLSPATVLSGGSASITVPAGAMAVGTDTLKASYTPDSASASTWNGAAGTSLTVTVTAPKITPTLTVTPAWLSIASSQSLNVTVSISAANTSTVIPGNLVLNSGTYTSAAITSMMNSAMITVPAGALSIGTDTLTVTFTPDPVYSAGYAATTASVTVLVGSVVKPTVTAASSTSTITTAQSLGVGIVVNGGSGGQFPTGTVTLSSGSYASSATSLTFGQVNILIPAGALAIGTDTLTASYTPDSASASLYGSASGTTAVTVSGPARVAPTMTATPSSTSITTIQGLTISVALSGASGSPTPTGSLTLTGGGYSSVPASLAVGAATIALPAGSLATGTDTLMVSYTPDNASLSTYLADSIKVQVSVTAAQKATAPTLGLSLSSASITTAQTLTVTATVSGGAGSPTPTGSASLTGGGYTSSAATLSSGSVSILIPAGSLATGTDTLTVSYTPDNGCVSTYLADSTNAQVLVTAVAKATAPTLGISLSSTSITTAQTLMVTATVSGGTGSPAPTGSVSLTGGGYTSSAATLSSGSVSILIPAGSLGVGTDTLAASYTPDSASSATYLGTSGTASITVAAPPATGFTIDATSVSVAPGATEKNSSTITVTPSGGLTGSVALTAAITTAPANAQYLPTLAFGSTSPVSLTGATAGTATLTISTTAPSSAFLARPQRPGTPWYAAGSATLACILLFGFPVRRRNWRNLLAMPALLVALAGGILACGAGGNSPENSGGGSTNPGTTPGSYTITVTGTAGTTTAGGTVTLTVQ